MPKREKRQNSLNKKKCLNTKFADLNAFKPFVHGIVHRYGQVKLSTLL